MLQFAGLYDQCFANQGGLCFCVQLAAADVSKNNSRLIEGADWIWKIKQFALTYT